MIGFLQSIVTIVLFFAILGILVVIHELGHFVTARLANVRVLEFGVGFPPRAKVLRAKGETLYTLNWLPIGGFVKLEGEDGDHADDPRSFSSQGLARKLIILVAGVLMNVAARVRHLHRHRLAGVAATSACASTRSSPGRRPRPPGSSRAMRSSRSMASATSSSLGPSILDGLRAKAGRDDRPDRGRAGRRRDATSRSPCGTRRPSTAGRARSASRRRERRWEAYFDGSTTDQPLPDAVVVGADQTVRALGLIVGGLGTLVGSVAADPTAPPPVAGPVGIATQIGDIFWNAGPILTLYVAGILSANLAVVNILPFPPLDGGRMLMITLKRIFGARISLRAEQLTYVVGFVFLFAFIIWVTGFDIIRSLGGGSPGSP